MTFKAMALDLSLAGTGIAWWTGGPRVGLRTVRSKHDGHQRLQDICTAVATATAHVGWPDLAIIEGLYVGHNNNTLQLAELHGLIKQQLWIIDVPYVLMAPNTRAVYATGGGRADKQAVKSAVEERYGILCANDGESDALAMLAAALDHYGCSTMPTVPGTHRRALKAVRWPDIDPASGGVTAATALPPDGGLGTATARTGRDASTPTPLPDAATTDRSSTLPIEAGMP